MALKADPADQALLLDLQTLDTRLTQLGHRASSLPELATIATLTTEREELQRTLTDRTGSWEDARAELKRTEADVEVVDARIARDAERLQTSSSPKDVQALEQELAALTKRKSDLEDIELAVMETVEERETLVDDIRGALAELDSKLAEATGARDAALTDLEGERAHAVANRQTVSAKVPAELLGLYEKQRQRYGIGASLLRGGVTSATGVTLTASDMNTIRAAAPDDVLICPDSSAILVRTGESGL